MDSYKVCSFLKISERMLQRMRSNRILLFNHIQQVLLHHKRNKKIAECQETTQYGKIYE